MKLKGQKVVTAVTLTSTTVQCEPRVPKTTPVNVPVVSVQEVGCAKSFVHKVQILPNAVPVQQKLRRLPFSMRQAVSEELQDLQERGVIECIDASPWVSPMVVTQRRDGGRPCMPLHPESHDITAFITQDGLFRFCRVPFGLAQLHLSSRK